MNTRHLRRIFQSLMRKGSGAAQSRPVCVIDPASIPKNERIGIIAGNGSLPFLFASGAAKNGCSIYAVAHTDETDPSFESHCAAVQWIKVGQLGTIIDFFLKHDIRKVAMVGGINRVRLFGGVKLDMRGAALIMRLGSAKDDVIMRGIAEELEVEGIEVISSVVFMQEQMAPAGVLTEAHPTREEYRDIEVGTACLQTMSGQDVGQLVVVKDGVVVAVEAVEGSDATIRRGGELGGAGTVIVKFAKPTQDMRFDVPTIGKKTIQSLIAAKARLLAIEAGRCLLLDAEEVIALADDHGISIVGCAPLVSEKIIPQERSVPVELPY